MREGKAMILALDIPTYLNALTNAFLMHYNNSHAPTRIRYAPSKRALLPTQQRGSLRLLRGMGGMRGSFLADLKSSHDGRSARC